MAWSGIGLCDDAQATHMFGRNDKCVEYNCSMLNKLPGMLYDYFAVDNSSPARVGRKAAQKDDERDPAMPFVARVSLKVGTHVVIAKSVVGNMGTITTGTTAEVIRFQVDRNVSDLQWVSDPQLRWSGHASQELVKQAIVDVNSMCIWPVVRAIVGGLEIEAYVVHGGDHYVVHGGDHRCSTCQQPHSDSMHSALRIDVTTALKACLF